MVPALSSRLIFERLFSTTGEWVACVMAGDGRRGERERECRKRQRVRSIYSSKPLPKNCVPSIWNLPAAALIRHNTAAALHLHAYLLLLIDSKQITIPDAADVMCAAVSVCKWVHVGSNNSGCGVFFSNQNELWISSGSSLLSVPFLSSRPICTHRHETLISCRNRACRAVPVVIIDESSVKSRLSFFSVVG